MSKSPQHLIQRNQIWYARMIIPEDVRDKFKGKREFIKSLKTKDLRVAKRLASEYIEIWKQEIDTFRNNSVEINTNNVIENPLKKEIIQIKNITRKEYLTNQKEVIHSKNINKSDNKLHLIGHTNLNFLYIPLIFLFIFASSYYGIMILNHNNFINHESDQIKWLHSLPTRIFKNKWTYSTISPNKKNTLVKIDSSFFPKWFSMIHQYEKNDDVIEVQFYFEYKCKTGDEIISDQKFSNGKNKKLVCVEDKKKNKTWMAHSFLSSKNQKRILGDLDNFHATIFIDNLEKKFLKTAL